MLENFAYGDTPSREALSALLDDLLAAPGEELVVAEYDLSTRFDVRQLVLKTLLTYLELEGLLRQGTPFYAGYRIRPLDEGGFDELFVALRRGARGLPEPRHRWRASRGACGSRWRPTTSPGSSERSARGSSPRSATSRIRASSSCSRPSRASAMRCSQPRDDRAALVDEMLARFERRERAEIERIQRVLALVTADECQVRALVAYFGEERQEPCGHCSHCLSGAVELPPATPLPEPTAVIAPARIALLRVEHPAELGQPRQLARFLCGLSSPATTRAKLTRHELYGALAAHRFADVLAVVGS